MFQLRLGSSLLMCIASLASWVTWEGSLSIMVKWLMEGSRWWWSIHGVSGLLMCWTWSVPWLSPWELVMFLQHMKSYTHLPGIPSGRQCPSFVWWRPCLWDASAMILGCLLPWNRPVWVCTWRSFWRIHSDLENKEPRQRIASWSLSQSPGGWVGHFVQIFHICQSSIEDNCCNVKPCLSAPFLWPIWLDLNIHFQLYPWGLLPQLSLLMYKQSIVTLFIDDKIFYHRSTSYQPEGLVHTQKNTYSHWIVTAV